MGNPAGGSIPARPGFKQVEACGAISLVNNSFASFLSEEMPGAQVVPAALAGWNKYLSLHLHMMLLGYRSAVELDSGDVSLKASFYGRLRPLLGTKSKQLCVSRGTVLADALRKLLDYYPQAREAIFDVHYLEGERLDATNTPWMTVEKAYLLKRQGWFVNLNGRDVVYNGGFGIELSPNDEISIFPPTR